MTNRAWDEAKFVVITGSRDLSELQVVLGSCSVRCWRKVVVDWYVGEHLTTGLFVSLWCIAPLLSLTTLQFRCYLLSIFIFSYDNFLHVR